MFKSILIVGLLCTVSSAESFDTFLQKAIKNSSYLQSSSLGIKQAKEEGFVLTRYKNPSLELEYSSFDADNASRDNGYRTSYSQPIRLWGVGDDKANLSNDMIKSAHSSYALKKALFIRDISMNFTLYSKQKMLLALGDEELSIAKTIYKISQARYEAGTISRAIMLQAKIDYETVQIANETLSLSVLQAYYELLNIAGIDEEIVIDPSYKFVAKKMTNIIQNPRLKLLHAQQTQALASAQLNSHSLEWMNLFVEYEKVPAQDITRIGVNIPLAIFNTKTEEKKIATLEANRAKLLINNESKQLKIKVNKLEKEHTTLENLYVKNREILQSEMELLDMFQKAYKIANVNLLQLQDIKNRVIATKRNLIQINTALNQNAITRNYNQGLYND